LAKGHRVFAIIIPGMTNPASAALADKLLAEGERTTAFFDALSEAAWSHQLYTDGKAWSVALTLEHLILAERQLAQLIERVAGGGSGAPDDFDVDGFNAAQTGALGVTGRPALLANYRAQREATAALARRLDADQLARRGRHPAMGDSSVADMLKMIYLHNTLHIKDIKKLLQ
jgi:hypothetical protein